MADSCPVCGAPVASSEHFCGSCGTAVNVAGTVAGQVQNSGDLAVRSVEAPSQVRATSGVPFVNPASAPGGATRVAQLGGTSLPTSPPPPPAMSVKYNQSVNVSANVAFVQRQSGPNLLVRAIWFIFIGWWLGFFAITLAYLLFIPIITIPLGLATLNRIPQIMTLRPRTVNYSVTQDGDQFVVEESTLPQRPWWQRVLYLVVVGWWFGAIWLSAAWFVGVVTFGLGLPLSFWMFNRTGAVISLYRT